MLELASSTVTQDTGIAIGVVGVLVTSMVGCTVWITTRISTIDSRLAKLEEDHYTKAEAEAHALRLALENPGLTVPDPRNPGKFIRDKHTTN